MTDSGVGNLVVGATIDRIQKECDVVSDSWQNAAEGDSVRLIRVAIDSTTVEALLVDNRVWRVEIASRGLITADSIGVGSLLGHILRGNDVTGIEGEGALYVRLASHCGISFRTTHQPDDERDKAEWTSVALAQLPDTVAIDRLLVLGCGGR